jgi:hypothetical protein
MDISTSIAADEIDGALKAEVVFMVVLQLLVVVTKVVLVRRGDV